MDDLLPLVSVCIITYNSSKTVVETLDSVLAQTYPHIELLVSDDCSTDDTVSVCRSWLESHGNRFVRVELLIRQINGGVAANLNTVTRAAKGEWVKTIAGDDLLMPDCIKDNMDYVSSRRNQDIVFSKMSFFMEDSGKRTVLYSWEIDKGREMFYKETSSGQFNLLLSSCIYVPGVTVFQRKSFAVSHPYPEEYSFCEDWPHWTHLAKSGIRLQYFDKETVLYRVNGSLSHPSLSCFIDERFHHSMIAFFYAERYPLLKKLDYNEAIKQKREFFLGDVAIVLLRNHKNLFTRIILYVFKVLLGTRKVV